MMHSSSFYILPLLLSTCITEAHAQVVVDRDFQILRQQQGKNSALMQKAVPLKNNTQTKKSAAVTATPDTEGATDNAPQLGKASSYTSTMIGPTLYAKSTHYYANFTFPYAIPEGMGITSVSWKYSLSQHPLDLEALLCWNQSEVCLDVSLAETGNSTKFNGKDPQGHFTIHYRYGGKGYLNPPLTGQQNQIIVNFAPIQ